MDFVLALHSHMPYVLHHGRWPHGSDWLSEAAVDTYLPLLEMLLALEKADVRAPVTLGITPILANQLSHPDFEDELSDYFDHRVEACDAAPETLARSGDAGLVGIAEYWRERFHRLRDLLHAYNCDLVAAFRGLADRGRIEILSSCATHGFLPLLGRDESIRLQLHVGRAEHRRLFGRDPNGIWLPECAYRPSGRWAPEGARPRAERHGTGFFLSEAGYRYFFVDSHLADAGPPLEYEGEEVLTGAARPPLPQGERRRSPYRAYRVPGARGKPPLAALVRDPRSTLRVWSRQLGYPGDGSYLEFHKIRWPEGLKLWKVTGGNVDLGGKQPYDPAAARTRAYLHAQHFAGFLSETEHLEPDGELIAAPFDTELFGHWWSEGPDFLGDLYRSLGHDGIRPTTATEHLSQQPALDSAQLREGSWGANGDFSMWLNQQTAWTWRRMWPLEDAFWDSARAALRDEKKRVILEQAARSLLLAQASDWQFVISTGAATDYAEKRFAGHCEDAELLVGALTKNAAPGAVDEALRKVETLRRRDDVFPNILDSIAAVARN